MAVTDYGVNNALAVKLWSRKLFEDALKATYASKFIGKGSSSLIQIQDDTSKSAGDKITIGLRMQLSGRGVQGDGTLEGNEEALTTYDDAIYINQIRHAVRSNGKMSEQRVPFSVRDNAKAGLEDWFADRIDTWLFNQLCGNTAVTDTLYTGNQATLAPDTAHYVNAHGSSSNDQDITSSDIFNLNLVDYAVEKAKTGTVKVRPVKYAGEEKFIMFLHPYQVTDMRKSTTTGQWLDIQKAAMQNAKIDPTNNAIFTGALGEYNGVILHESTRATQGVNSSTSAAISTVRRAVLCGAQSACMAVGQGDTPGKMTWVEELFDYQNQLGVAAGMIAGLKKTRFNSADFGTVVVSSYATTHG